MGQLNRCLSPAPRLASVMLVDKRCSWMRTGRVLEWPMAQAEVYQMIRRRAVAAGIATKISYHSFRATGIIFRMAESWKSRSRWPGRSPRVRPGFMTGGTIPWRSMRSSPWFTGLDEQCLLTTR